MAQEEIKRRRFPRRRYSSPVGILFAGRYQVRHGFEISEGGMLCELFDSAQDQSPVVLSFYVPGRDFVTVRGVVVYVKPPSEKMGGQASMGVKFQNLPFAHRRFIRDYIADKTQVEAALD